MTIQEHLAAELQRDPCYSPAQLRAAIPHLTIRASQRALLRARRKLGLIHGSAAVWAALRAARAKSKTSSKSTIRPTPSHKSEPHSLAEDRADAAQRLVDADQAELKRKYNELLKDSALTDRLVRIAQDLAPRSYETAAPVLTPPKAGHTPQSAVLLLSDAHIGKIVRPEQTMGWGEYNFAKFQSRLKHLEQRVASILLDHTQFPVNRLVIAMLGDMVDGSLIHGAEAAQAATVFTQVYAGAHVIAQFVRNLSAYVPQIEIQAVVGNHGRWASQAKMPTKNRYSNLDMFLYAMVQALVRDIPSVQFPLDEQPYKTFLVEGQRIWIGHGDHLRGGDKALGIPVHAIGRQLSTTTQMHALHGQQVPSIYCVGDKHKRIELPHANGDFLVNGAFPGYDEYAHASNFADAGPDQKLFLVHPTYGRTATYNIYLQHAEDVAHPYSIPSGFQLL